MAFVVTATIGSALIGSDSSRKAANTQADTTREGIAEQRRQYDLTREDYAPWRSAGVNALQSLATDINGNPTAAEVMQDPGYQFGMEQGQQALDRKASASGGRVSGAALKAASRFGTNYASTGYNAAYQRRQDRLNRLQALAGIGQTATAGSAMAGANMANQVSNMQTGLGNARAGAIMNQGQVWANAGNNLAALYGRNSGTGWGGTPFGIQGTTDGGSGINNGYGSDTIFNGWGG